MHEWQFLQSISILMLLGLVPVSCDDESVTAPDEGISVTRDFTTGPQWKAGFSDYPVGQEDFFELVADYRPLPEPLDTSQSAHFISGNNHSDDLWMYYKGSASGFLPNRTYQVQFDVEIATNVPHGCIGVGGAPGESVWVKAGLSVTEPQTDVVGGDFQMNIDKGNQSTGGRNAVVLGDVANSVPCGEEPRWERKRVSSQRTLEITTDASGVLWFFVGTDSGFESTTSLYYLRYTAMLEPT